MLIHKPIRCLILALTVALLSLPASAQELEVTGTVTDNEGPMAGVVVQIKDAASGVVTDARGQYNIRVPGSGSVLQFSFLGYSMTEETVGQRNVINVTLERTAIEVDELVVLGYGVQRKSHLTGAITKFDPEGIANIPTSDITTALQGRLSGVTIQNITSEVGVAPQIRVRGSGALNSGGSPLVVVDGFIMEDGLQMINPSDIASIEILKDASSAAIYGSRASAGVIIITTKEGEASKPRYNVSMYTGIKMVYKLHPLMNYTEWVDILDFEEQLGANKVPTGDRAAAWLESQYPMTDWQKEGLRSIAQTNNIQISLSGGNNNVKYVFSGGFVQDEGLLKQNFNNKFNIRSRMDINLSKYVTVGTNISAVYSESQRPTNSFVDFMRFSPSLPIRHNEFTSALTGQPVGSYAQGYHFNTGTKIYPVGDIDPVTGERELIAANPFNTQNHTPASIMDNTYNKSHQYQFSGNIYMNIKFTPDLVFRTANSLNVRYSPRETYTNKDASRMGREAEGTFRSSLLTRWASDNTLTYMKKFGRHDLNAMAGMSFESKKVTNARITGTGFPNDYIRTLSAATAFKVLNDSGVKLTSTDKDPPANLASFFGRINYSYNDRYLASILMRADGYSYFGKNDKWGYFPSVSIGWRMSEENFMKNIPAISMLKFRASYGVTGNNNLDKYATVDLLSSALYSFGEGNGTPYTGLANISSILGNPDLTWEQVNEYNVGMDFGVLKNTISLTLDAYYSTTKNLLFLRPTSSITGFTQFWTNEGKIRNKGIELTIDTYNFNKSDFKWQTSANISFNRNRLLDLGGEAQIIQEGYSQEGYINIVGQKAIQFYGYKTQGIWLTREEMEANPHHNLDRPGTLRAVNVYDDGVIDDKDMTVIGDPYPDFTWGITNTFSYKGFDLSFLFQGVQGGQVYHADGTYNDIWRRSKKFNSANRWVTEEYHGDGKTPTGYGIPWIQTDYLVEDASYLCLRNVTLGYTFNKKVLQSIHLKKLRAYVTGNNLLYVWSKNFRGINPEYRNTSSPYNDPLVTGYQRGSFPLISTISFGIDINF